MQDGKRGVWKTLLNLAYFGIITRKSPEILRFQDFLVEISGIEPLLFVCLKDSQSKKENLISEEIRFGGDKRDRTADLLNAISGNDVASCGISWQFVAVYTL